MFRSTIGIMAISHGRGHGALRRGRWSAADAEYFLTFCTDGRKCGLAGPRVSQAIRREALALDSEEQWLLRTFVIMPDHVHLIIGLGTSLVLSEVARLFKGRLAPELREESLRWERGYFDHRLRLDEDLSPVFRYVLLNPYRAGLLPTTEKWHGYFCSADDWAWFGGITNGESPFPEWLR